MIEKFILAISINPWTLFVTIGAILLILAEAGYRSGVAKRRHNSETGDKQGAAIQAAVLGLLGLLLAFSFAMAVGRYESRRTLVTEEANSIGTTWLRADFIPEPHRQEAKRLLEEYTELRLEGFKAADDPEAVKLLLLNVSRIHNELWLRATAVTAEQPSPVTMSFVTSLNETIDFHARRMAEARNRIPPAVWLLLIVVSGCGAWSSGFQSGVIGQRSIFSQLLFPALISIVVTMISDIDSPRKGVVDMKQTSMEELLQSIQTPED